MGLAERRIINIGPHRCEIFWSDEDESYIGICPDYPGLSVWAEDQDGVAKELDIVIQAFQEIYEEYGFTLA